MHLPVRGISTIITELTRVGLCRILGMKCSSGGIGTVSLALIHGTFGPGRTRVELFP